MKKEIVLFSNFDDYGNEEELDMLFENIDYSNENWDCVVCGVIDMWNGRKEIYPTRFPCLTDAIRATIYQADFIEIKQVNGHIEVKAAHHDGTNAFQIYLLNENGITTENGDLSNRRYHRAIKGSII